MSSTLIIRDVIGTWKYKVETDEGTLTGTMKIEKKEGKLLGEVNTDDGETFAFSKVLEGTVGNDGGSFPMTCEKVE